MDSTLTTDETALRRAILLSPADDAPRLVYADWLDENGNPDRAEFIRLQHRPQEERLISTARERKLLRSNWRKWFAPTFIKAMGGVKSRIEHFCSGLSRMSVHFSFGDSVSDHTSVGAFINRGFVSSIHCSTTTFLGGECTTCPTGRVQRLHRSLMERRDRGRMCRACGNTYNIKSLAVTLFTHEPVVYVYLKDRQPMTTWQDYRWILGNDYKEVNHHPQAVSHIPGIIFHAIPSPHKKDGKITYKLSPFVSIKEVISDAGIGKSMELLSQGAVIVGRKLAGVEE